MFSASTTMSNIFFKKDKSTCLSNFYLSLQSVMVFMGIKQLCLFLIQKKLQSKIKVIKRD